MTPETSADDLRADLLLGMTGAIVQGFTANNHVAASELPALIAAVHGALVSLGAPAATVAVEPAVEQPTASRIRKSITPDALISFIDGKPYKTLKRHLTKHGLDPHSYRERFGLPSDYPTTAAAYSAQRSALAKSIGLGVIGAQALRAAA